MFINIISHTIKIASKLQHNILTEDFIYFKMKWFRHQRTMYANR